MKLLPLFALFTLFGLNISCDRADRDRSGDDIQREEAVDEMGHEMDELGDEIEDKAEEID